MRMVSIKMHSLLKLLVQALRKMFLVWLNMRTRDRIDLRETRKQL